MKNKQNVRSANRQNPPRMRGDSDAAKNKQQSNPFPAMEEAALDFWDKAEIFKKSVAKPAPRGDYVFYDGPPFGTGEPHYGHILSSIAKDVVPRYWTMRGFRVERRWGWDCHGLPIENIIEKDLGISGKKEVAKIGIDKFNEACRSRVLEYADIWDKMVRRIGRWVDFKNSYKTMDLTFMESVWWGFSELWNKDLIYQGRKVLLYCPRCETPISNFEVAMDNSYKDISETSVYVKFRITNFNELKTNLTNNADVYILAWTTTPWTLPGNVALAVGEEISYVLIERYDSEKNCNEYFIVSRDFYDDRLMKDLGDMDTLQKDGEPTKYVRYGSYEIISMFKGKDLVGLEYKPLFDVPAIKNSGKKVYYVASGDFVTTEDGTGVVHTAVVYGEDDYNLGLKLDLPVVPALDEKGYFNDTVPQFKGVYFTQANKLIIEDLDKRGLLFAKQNITHSYPHCHRCETQLFYNAIPAWFLSVSKLKKRMLELNEKINWFPEHLKYGRFALGIEQAPDWNISRNRFFATPIPVWQCDKCGAQEIIGSVAELQTKSGRTNINDIHSHYIDDISWSCAKCGGAMRRIKEVFDCWVESGSMSFAQLHYPFANKEKFEKNFPAQFISEYISQTRAWFYVMHVMSTALFDSNSFENVIGTGVILNERGEKLSKSKMNYPNPWKVINEFGVDALRFYLMNSSLMRADNLFFNERDLRDVFRKNVMILWNVYKYYELYEEEVRSKKLEVRSEEGAVPESENILDKWILARLNQLISEVTESMDKYDIPRATRPMAEFINDLSTWYLRRSRDRFKGDDEKDKQAAIQTTGYVLMTLAKVMAPFMPFMAETIWQKVTGHDFKDEDKSVHLESWPGQKSEVRSKKLEMKVLEEMELVRKIVGVGLAKRDEAGIKVRQSLNELRITNCELRIEYEKLIKDELNVKNVLAKTGKGELKVELDTTITEELKLEGLKREIVRLVNGKRKDMGLTIQDRIVLHWRSDSEIIKQVFKTMAEEIKKDTLSEEIVEDGGTEMERVKVNEEEMEAGIKKLETI